MATIKKDKYYLLTFEEDWADEHNVPALACFTEDEFEDWKNTRVGIRDKKYAEKLEEFNKKVKAYEDWSRGDRKGVCPAYVNSYHDRPREFRSKLNAWLGNSGDGFGDDYQFEFAKEMIDKNVVKVTVVDESFHKFFHKADLSGLSLCNVFELEGDYDEDDE